MNFLNNRVNILINTDVFLTHHYHIYFEKNIYNGIVRAYEVDNNNKRKHIKSTLGEYFEREVLLNNNCMRNTMKKMISLIDGSEKNIPLSELVFIDGFVDSCGMASHVCSEEVIWNAYKEFFERQSFIANFLFRLPGYEIEIGKYEKLLEWHQYILNYLDEIKYYNISLCDEIFVTLAIGWSDRTKAAGLGTSRSMHNSIKKAQKEMLQYFAAAKSKRNIEEQNLTANGDLYHLNFERMSVSKFKQEYAYLLESQKDISFKRDQFANKDDIMLKNYRELNMNPYIAVFSPRETEGIKVVKIYDDFWFPHMYPPGYEKDKVGKLEKRFGWKRRNYSEMIPFA
mgnify:CR=1 FL=1